MTSHILERVEPVAVTRPSIAERLEGTALDPAKGRAREYTVLFALTTAVLVTVFALTRLVTFAQATGPRRSIVQDAKSTASSALAYAYRH
ncbi:MAG: hypothetical protein AAGJ94_01305 [Pseudomonadota bacterium]